MRPLAYLFIILHLACASRLIAADIVSLQADLKQFCFRCHGEDKVKGKVDLVKAFAAIPHGLTSDLDLIETMIETLANEEMPPENEKQPTAAQRRQWIAQLKLALNVVLQAQPAFTHVPIRRMNRLEYNNAVKALFELSCNSHKDNRESIYFDNISWYGTGHVAPSMRDPRKVYRRLFGTEGLKDYRDISDIVLEDAREFRKELGFEDSHKFEEYFESVRSIEKQIDKIEKKKDLIAKIEMIEPDAVALPRREYIRLMGDLMMVALQNDLTRVATIMVGPERWDTPTVYEGVFDKPQSHHGLSHAQHKELGRIDLEKIDRFHVEQFAYLVAKMDSIREGERSLLDNTVFTMGSGLGDGEHHQYSELPIVTAGSGGARFDTGRLIKCPDGTPLANLWLSYAHLMGAGGKRFADSTGPLKQLGV